tara:strand:- start:29 stop:196 length:168 start_codon:yes stop_codon:yes gene_type:complete
MKYENHNDHVKELADIQLNYHDSPNGVSTDVTEYLSSANLQKERDIQNEILSNKS